MGHQQCNDPDGGRNVFQPQNAKQVDDLATAGKMLTPLLGNAASVILQQRFCSPEFHRASPREWRAERFFRGFNKPYEIKSKETRWGILLTMIPAAAVILLIDSPFQGLLYSQMFLGMQLPDYGIYADLSDVLEKVMGKIREQSAAENCPVCDCGDCDTAEYRAAVCAVKRMRNKKGSPLR